LLVLDAQAAVHLALVLHELATNARKHGALSVPYGRLSVTWQMRTNGGCSLLLSWRESNGPKVSAPSAHGFGRTLIEQTVRAHGGEASIEYRTDGLTCEIKLPLPEAARSAGADAAASKTSGAPSLLAAPSERRTLHGKRILLIEDEPLVAMDVESTLTAAGCKVVGQAATLERAKQLIEESDCDAALVDVNLAGQPVDELATLLTRKNRPFAFVTGYGREALPAGFRGAVVLGKPFGADQLDRDGRSLALSAGQRHPVEAEKNLAERSVLDLQGPIADQFVGRMFASLASFTVAATSSRTNRSNCSTLIGCGWTPSFASLS